ncbi:MAG: metallophosphoesterase, partial [Actinomycetota bacterium]
GLASIDLVRRIQPQAEQQGGKVVCLMGNHEIFLLGARLFPDRQLGPSDYTLMELWRANGGVADDLKGLTDEHVEWLSGLPSVVVAEPYLLIHADSQMYTQFGDTAEEANATVTRVLRSDRASDWDVLVTSFVRRNELWDRDASGDDAIRMLFKTFGGETIVHGHTPIPMIIRRPAPTVTEPLTYSGGRCINVDGGMFLGGPGFIHRLDK